MHNNQRMASVAGALVLVIGMGFGRFAFTGLHPLMTADGQITVEGAAAHMQPQPTMLATSSAPY
jgi:hypothetical protein